MSSLPCSSYNLEVTHPNVVNLSFTQRQQIHDNHCAPAILVYSRTVPNASLVHHPFGRYPGNRTADANRWSREELRFLKTHNVESFMSSPRPLHTGISCNCTVNHIWPALGSVRFLATCYWIPSNTVGYTSNSRMYRTREVRKILSLLDPVLDSAADGQNLPQCHNCINDIELRTSF